MTATVTQSSRTANVQALWHEYNETGDPALRDRLVLSLAPMVKYIVFRKVREIPAQFEVEDFIACEIEALIKTIDRYDPARGVPLEHFAWSRIHGAVLDELRRADWAPRSVRRSEREIGRARERFIALHGRAPSRAELSEELGINESALDSRLGDIARSDVGSLNALVMSDDDTTIERVDTLVSDDHDSDPESSSIREQAKLRFRAAFERLPERERQVAVLLYVHELTLREIGDVLGVTESRVCQIHSQLRRRLKTSLMGHSELFAAFT
jgi:RNA polymerase sigma factor for flagellar operon FliA